MVSDKELKYLASKLDTYSIQDSDVGVITVADYNVFTGLQHLYTSIKNKINFLCYDIGLTDQQLKWCSDNNLCIKKLSIDHFISKNLNWQTYCKPWAFECSPFKYSIWIDVDCIVVGNLSKLFHITNRRTFFTKHWVNSNRLVKNKSCVYTKYPITHLNEDLAINAGVIGLDLTDRVTKNILNDWKKVIIDCQTNIDFLENFAAWDEGILLWAIQNNNAYSLIEPNGVYNHYAAIGSSPFEGICIQQTPIITPSTFTYKFYDQIIKHKDKGILHFSSCMKNQNKYWKMWPLK